MNWNIFATFEELNSSHSDLESNGDQDPEYNVESSESGGTIFKLFFQKTKGPEDRINLQTNQTLRHERMSLLCSAEREK